jgi:hypothetical protein
MLRPGVVKREKTGFLVSHAVTVPEHGGTLVGPWWKYCQDGSNPFAGVLHLSRVPHRNQEPAIQMNAFRKNHANNIACALG